MKYLKLKASRAFKRDANFARTYIKIKKKII